MTSSARSSASPGAPALDDPTEHATAEAVVWAGSHAIVVGSAGRTDPTPANANPVFVDGAQYHGWMRAVDAHGTVAWTRRLDGGRELHVRAVAALADDLVIAGEQRAGDARAYTGWVARIASSGDERWRLGALGTAGVTGFQAVAVRGDGVVVAGGMQQGKAWLVAVDGHGKLAWEHEVAGLDQITAVTAIGGGVVVTGVAGRTTTSAGKSRVIAIDATAMTLWNTAVPEQGPGELYAMAPLGRGGVAVGQAPGPSGRDGAWIVCFGANGAIQSSQVVSAAGSTGIDAARAVTATADGGFVVAGESFDQLRGRRGHVWRFDGTVTLLWEQAYGDGESLVRGVAATPDGDAVVVGATQASGSPLRPWTFDVDPKGAPRWTVR